jgi:hypothetical protein
MVFEEAARLLDGDARSGSLATFGAVIASLRTSFATLVRYQKALDAAGAKEYFVELPPQNDVGRMATIAFTLPLQEQGGTAQVVHSLTVKVTPDHPRVLASTGLMWTGQGFPFRKLAIAQVPATGSDGKPVLTRTLTTTAESGAVRPVAGLLATGVRVGGSRSPLYATIGTTIDNNIFRTLMVGGAVFIARWRSSIVAGALTSRGATEADLAPTIRAYSNGGVALDGLDLDKVPLDDRPYRGHVAACEEPCARPVRRTVILWAALE